MDYASRNMEDSCAQSNLNCLELDKEVSEGKNFRVLHRNHSCDILVREEAAFALFQRFCPRLK